MHLYYDHTVYRFPLYIFLWPEDGPQWPKHVSLIIRIQDSCILTYPTTSLITFRTYLLTPWCRVLLEKLTGLQLVKKFPAFHGTRRFITALTSIRHLSLSWASPIQSIYPYPTSWRSIQISIHLRLGLPSSLLPPGFPAKTLYNPSPHSYTPHAQPISFFSILSPAQYWVRSTSFRHLSLSWASPIQSIYPHPTSWSSVLQNIVKQRNYGRFGQTYSFHLRLPCK